MDNIFARCADVVALAGRSGINLCECVETVLQAPPRPAVVNWVQRSFAARPGLFIIHLENNAVARVVASQCFRERALGYSLLEHAPLQSHSWNILEAVGQAGQQGVLQSELGPKVNLSPVMVHHYLGALIALRLVARRKVVLTSHHVANIDRPGVKTDLLPEKVDVPNLSDSVSNDFALKKTVAPYVTQTSVIVLARFAANIDSSNAAELLSTPAGAVPAVPGTPKRALFDVDVETRVQRVLQSLQDACGGLIPQRDLKLVAIPDSECPHGSPRDKFVRRRHRIFRVVRAKMLKANLVRTVFKECVDVNGKAQGKLPCFALVNPDSSSLEKSAPVAQVVTAAAEDDDDVDEDDNYESDDEGHETFEPHQQNHSAPSPRVLFEVDIAEQVYQTLNLSGSRGMSCPDVVAHLDGETGLTGIEYKRTRTLLRSINKTNPIQSLQHFSGSACHKRFVLKKNHVSDGREWPRVGHAPDKNNEPVGSSSNNPPHSKPKAPPGRSRTTSGALTTLGEQRKAIIEDLLMKRKVLQIDKIGREVAEAEGVREQPVDSKVIRKVIETLVKSKACCVIGVNKPSLTASRKVSFIKLLVLPEVSSNSPEVRSFLASLVKRTMVPNKDSFLPPGTAKPARRSKKRSRSQLAEKSDNVDTPVQLKGERREDIVELKSPAPAVLLNEVNNPAENTPLSDPTNRGLVGNHEKSRPSTQERLPDDLGCLATDTIENADSLILSTDGVDDLSSNLCVVVKARRADEDPKESRIAKLRAVDYGWIKPKMRRVRLFHEHLVDHVVQEKIGVKDEGPVAQSTLETAAQTEDLGKFKLQDSFTAMTVRQFANMIGLHEDHGLISESTFQMDMKSAPAAILAEAKSKTATGQVRILFSILLRLGLVHSAEDSSWILRGAGLLRDFGRGIPLGTSSHCIVFSSRAAIRTYWDELESLANHATVISTYVPDVSSFPNGLGSTRGKGGDGESLPQMHETAQVLDVYVPARWRPSRTGYSNTTPNHELRMEVVLQTITSTVGWGDDGTMPKNITTWTLGPLARIPVKTLYNNASLLVDPKRDKIVRHSDIEQLMRYARKRSRQAVNNRILLLARKPSHDVKDLDWLRNSDVLTAQGVENADAELLPVKKRKSSKRRHKPASPLTRKRKRKSFDVTREEVQRKAAKRHRMSDGLSYANSVKLLTLITKKNSLVRHWQSQGVFVPDGENNPNLWREVAETAEKSVNECNTMLEVLRESDFVRRHLNILCDRLYEALRGFESPVSGDSHFVHMPDCVVDCYGEEIPLRLAVGSILGESNVQFGRGKVGDGGAAVRSAKRKNVLARLRTPSGLPSSFGSAVVTPKRMRRRVLTSYDKSEEVHYGVIQREEGDPVWVSPRSVAVQPSSEARNCVISVLLKAILLEPESTFDVRTALFALSRFPKREIIAVRNWLYVQNILSISEGEGRRKFEIDDTKRRPDVMYSAASHERASRSEMEGVSTLVRTKESVPSSDLFNNITCMNSVISQGALTATVQRMLFPGSKAKISMFSRLFESTGAEGVQDKIDLNVDFSAPEAALVASDESSSARTNVLRPTQLSKESSGAGLSNAEAGKVHMAEDGGSSRVQASLELCQSPSKASFYSLGLEESRSGCGKNGDNQLTSNLANCEAGNAQSIVFKDDVSGDDELTQLAKTAVASSFDAKAIGTEAEAGAEDDLSDDADEVRMEDEWVHEVNIRRIREMHAVAYYKSQLCANNGQKKATDESFADLREVIGITLQWISESRSKGITSFEISALAESRRFPGELVVKGVCELLREGIVHRFACGDTQKSSGRAPAIYFLTSYAWMFATAPASSERRDQFSVDWTFARPISPWMRMNGEYNAELVKAVQVHIINVLARCPGTEESSLVEKVLAREPLLPRRAVLDAISALYRAGKLRREIYSHASEPVTLFSSSKIGPVPEEETFVSKFPDGFELGGVWDKRIFYSASGSCVGRLLEAVEIDMVAKLTDYSNYRT